MGTRKKSVGLVLIAVVAALVAALLAPAAVGASTPAAPTVSGGVIKVGGIGYKANYGDAEIGAQARFQRANDTKEVKGYTFQWTEFADDKNDPATALSETRRLVSQDGIFSLIDVSLATPGSGPSCRVVVTLARTAAFMASGGRVDSADPSRAAVARSPASVERRMRA